MRRRLFWNLGPQDVSQPAPLLFKPQGLPMGGSGDRGASAPLDLATVRSRGVAEHRRRCAVCKQAGADQHARVVIEVHCGTADLNTHRQHVAGPAGPNQCGSRRQVRDSRRATLTDEIEGGHLRVEPKRFHQVTGQPGAQVTRARADQDRVNGVGGTVCIGKSHAR